MVTKATRAGTRRTARAAAGVPSAAPAAASTAGSAAAPAAAARVPAAHRRSRQSHEAVLLAAEELLRESGYSSITVDQIAERSGVSKATVYRWWPNKAAVFMELYGVLAQKQATQPADTGSLEGDLREQVRGAFRLFRRTVAGLALAGFVADAQSNPQTEILLRDTFASQRRALNMKLLGRAASRGELWPHVDIATAAEVITGAVYYAVLIGPRRYADADADRIVQVILQGIAVNATDPKRHG